MTLHFELDQVTKVLALRRLLSFSEPFYPAPTFPPPWGAVRFPRGGETGQCYVEAPPLAAAAGSVNDLEPFLMLKLKRKGFTENTD